jgi:hypothetical protein
MIPDHFQHYPASAKSGSLRLKGGQPGSNQICIDEGRAVGFKWQELTGKSGFPRTIRAGDDDFSFGRSCHKILVNQLEQAIETNPDERDKCLTEKCL